MLHNMRTCTFNPRVFIHNFTVPVAVGLEIMCHRIVVESCLKVIGHIGWIWTLIQCKIYGKSEKFGKNQRSEIGIYKNAVIAELMSHANG